MTEPEFIKKTNHAKEHLSEELGKIRTGRAQTSLVEDIVVEAYGSKTPLKGLATITTPEPRLIMISPWDKGLIKEIEKSLQNSDLGINPSVTESEIRLQIPELNAERREEIAKIIASKAEQTRITLRNIREEYLKEIKQKVVDKKVSEDELEVAKKKVQKIMDDLSNEIDKIVNAKTDQVKKI